LWRVLLQQCNTVFWKISANLYLIPRCLRGCVNNSAALPPVVYMVVTVCSTFSENIELAVEIILLLYTQHILVLCKHDFWPKKMKGEQCFNTTAHNTCCRNGSKECSVH
jgi:3-oxoacyl-(acyl-carrier-protein) synthase